MPAVLRFLGYLWCLPNSAIGAVLSLLAGGEDHRWVNGMVVVRVRWIPGVNVLAQTWGCVVLWNPRNFHPPSGELLAHERRHVTQSMLLGPLFLVAYPLASLVAIFRGRNFYRDNWFEADARRAGGEDD